MTELHAKLVLVSSASVTTSDLPTTGTSTYMNASRVATHVISRTLEEKVAELQREHKERLKSAKQETQQQRESSIAEVSDTLRRLPSSTCMQNASRCTYNLH